MTKQKRSRSKPRLHSTDEETPLEYGHEEENETRFDKIIEQARIESSSTDPKSTRRRRKKGDDTLLEKLKKGQGLKKEEDQTLLANTYDPDDIKGEKSNKWRQREKHQIHEETEEKRGRANLAYEDDSGSPRPKSAKRKIIKKAIIKSEDSEILSQTKTEKKENNSHTNEEDESLDSMVIKSESRRKNLKKKNTQKALEENSTIELENHAESQSDHTVLSEDDTKKQIRKKKIKKKKDPPPEDGVTGEDAVEEQEGEGGVPDPGPAPGPPPGVDDGRVIGVIIHRTDKLKTDFYIAHPLVRVHIIDLATGAPLKKQTRDRAVTSYYEKDNENVDFILPILTFPFDFKQNKSVLPVWEETLVFNENFNFIVNEEPSVMMFFEILDFVSMNTARLKYNKDRGEGGWHRIAWAFLKMRGAGGKVNTDRKVRLQLYRPPTRFNAKPGTPEVYQWWKSGQRLAYPSTLYATVKGMILPPLVAPATRSLFATQPEQGLISYHEIQKTLELGSHKRLDLHKSHKPSPWSRLPGQVCKVPNLLAYTLPVSRQGCFTLKFSCDGRKLACACHDKDAYPIIIYNIPEGTTQGQMLGHYRIIYDLHWSRDSKLLLSASSDCTARVWDGEQVSQTPLKLLPHPSYVYSARFHPNVTKVVVTGSYDRIVRLWSLYGSDVQAELMQELEGHVGHVYALCFGDSGAKLYSGDSLGKIKVWNAYTTDQASKKGVRQDWTGNGEISEAEMDQVAINHMTLHPNGRRLLLHCRDNVIRMLDLRINVIMQRYHGALNFREQIRSAITPCGSFVLSGSEDCTAYVWNAETGDRVASYKELSYQSSVVDVDYHPHDHLVAFCAYGENHPVLIYKYDHNVAQRDVGYETPVRLVSPRRTGRAASPEVLPTASKIIDSDSDMRARGLPQDELEVGTMARMERVQRKLEAVTGFFTSLRPSSPDHPLAVPPFGRTSTFGAGMTTMDSTFNSSAWYLPSDTETMSNLPPSMFSPHAGQSTLSATYQQQQQLAVENQYQRQSHTRPAFSAMGTHGSLHRPGSPPYGRMPTMSLNTVDGKPQFSIHSDPSASSCEKVTALYEYHAQRSDELSFVRGDVITVLYKDNENWWMGMLQEGQQGFFPASYVTGESEAQRTNEGDILEEYKLLEEKKEDEEDDVLNLKERMAAVISKSGELKIFSATESEAEVTTPKKLVKKRKPRHKEATTNIIMEDETTPASKKTTTRRKKKLRSQDSEA